MIASRSLLPLAALLATAGCAVALPAAEPRDTSKTIHPGVVTVTAGSCTSNFVFKSGDTLYLGQAAHCSGTGSASGTNGCSSGSLPEGTQVTITGAQHPGTMVYNSWVRMQTNNEQDANACAFNDFALVAIDPRDYDAVSPTVPQFGGPTGLASAPVEGNVPVFSYGNSVLRQGITLLSPKYGIQLSIAGDGWSHEVATLTPGIPGDSGSGFMTSDGSAFGTLSTLQFLPAPGTNGVGDLVKELEYARNNGFPDLELVKGDAPFTLLAPPDLSTLVPGVQNALGGGGLLGKK